MNSIDAKGNEFLQLNTPGNDGYGQVGSKGETGADGNSIYFTSYRNVNDASILIMEGKELSNNPDYNSSDITYKTNDYIIDSAGNINMIKIKRGELSFINSGNIFASGSMIDTLTCTLCISNIEDSSYYYKIKNENYLGEYNDVNCSPYICHRDRYNEYICGSWICFNTEIKEESDYLYKYVILLPNGLKIENITSTSYYEIFLDNRFLYGCIFSNNMMNDLKAAGNYYNIDNNNEYDYSFTVNLSDAIISYCTAYVDVTDKTTGKVYRKYAENIIRG